MRAYVRAYVRACVRVIFHIADINLMTCNLEYTSFFHFFYKRYDKGGLMCVAFSDRVDVLVDLSLEMRCH